MWQGALSGRAEAVGEDLMVGGVATLTRSPAGKYPKHKYPDPISPLSDLYQERPHS